MDTQNNKHKSSILLKVITFISIAAIAVLLVFCKPWDPAPTAKDRTVTVTGEAKISATPDEYVFYPTYEFKYDTKEKALEVVGKKTDELVTALKELGVADSKIKTSSDGHSDSVPAIAPGGIDTKVAVYNLQLTVTVADKEMAQKVQDYLAGTAPLGAVTPQAGFSKDLRRSLESKARDQATKDARKKAEQSATNLGFKVGKVKSVKDGQQFNDTPYTAVSSGADTAVSEAITSSPSIQPGENDLNYSVTVIYYIK